MAKQDDTPKPSMDDVMRAAMQIKPKGKPTSPKPKRKTARKKR